MKSQKQTLPLLIMIPASMLCASLMAAVGSQTFYKHYNTEGWAQPVVTVLMQGISSPKEAQAASMEKADSPKASQPTDPGNVIAGSIRQLDTEFSYGGLPEANISYNNGNPAELCSEPTQYEFTEVEPDYFDDALFIGDSRVVGVQLYSGWDNLTYYAESGMTIYNMFTCPAVGALSVEEALQERSFGKIYLEVGINEMGTGTVDSFTDAYADAVSHLRELQPDAVIYLCGIMYVKQEKSERDPIFNNPGIQERNGKIAQLANGTDIFYLDINEATADETGNLNPAYTWDEVHLLGKYDILWLEYFSSHAVVNNIE